MANRKINGHVITPHTNPWLITCKFDVGAGSAVTAGTQTATSYLTVTKPAGTGIYRATFVDIYPGLLAATAQLVKAAGTYDAKIDLVAVTANNAGTAMVVDFQVRKSSDGTALDPTSITIYMQFLLNNSQVTV